MLLNFSGTTFVYADAGEERTVYLSATEYDYPPFSVTDEGIADGFSVELLKAVAEEIGLQVTFKIDYWATIKEELSLGELDILPLVGYTEERDEVYDFTVPYIVMRGNIFVRSGDTSISSENDLFGKEVLVLDGDNSEEWAISIGLDCELTATSTYLEAFALLSSGQYDAVLAQGLVGEKIIFDNDINNITPVYIYEDDGVTRHKLNLEDYEQKFCFAVVENDSELLSILNEGLTIVSLNGQYDELYDKWFPFLIVQPQLSAALIFKYVGLALIPILFILGVIYIILVKSTVKSKTRQIENNNKLNDIVINAFQRDFASNTKKFKFALKELVSLNKSTLGFMFSVTNNKDIKIRSYYSNSNKIKEKCSHIILHKIIEENELIKKILARKNAFISNEYLLGPDTSRLILCGEEVHRLMAVLIEGAEQSHIVVLINKTTDYNAQCIRQTSTLLTGLSALMERADYLSKIEYMSFHDQLTNLYNRRFFEESLDRLDNADNLPLSIIIGDVNGLKLINDAFGHHAGDELLKTIATIITKNTRSGDIAARWGGDEFVIILPKSSSENAEALIKRLDAETKKASFKFGMVSVSSGTSTKTNVEEKISDVFNSAEKLMYQNKLDVVESVRGETIKTIMNTLFEKSVEVKEHSERVSSLASDLAKHVGLSESKINDIKTIGMIHDIGKIVIDLSILNKPSSLTKNERLIIEQHPISGSRMLASTHEYTRLASGVLHHHERIDGKGYPNGLKGDEIPIESKIIAIADAFDAMTAIRAYRKTPFSIEVAAAELIKNKGTQFDETFVDIFIEKVLQLIK